MSAQYDASALVKKIKRGMDGRFHIGKIDPVAAAGWEDVSWGEHVASVQSSESTVSIETAEATNRGNNGFKAYAVTLGDAGIKVTVNKDSEDEGYAAFRDAMNGRYPLAIADLDGPIIPSAAEGTTEGIMAICYVTNISSPKEMNGVVTVAFDLKPAPVKSTAFSTTWVEIEPSAG